MVDGVGNSAMLAGVRVLDLAALAAAPLAATNLGEFGADVIKVEQPTGGDPIRTWGNQRDGVGLMWKSVSRNKRSVTLRSPSRAAMVGSTEQSQLLNPSRPQTYSAGSPSVTRQRDILNFALTWGIGVSRYLAQLDMILQSSEGQSLSADQRRMLQEMIAQRGAATDTNDGR
jgi:hypothetical protein